MLEVKAANEMNDTVVWAKRDAAVKWCEHASGYTATYGGKPWQYLLIPHDKIAENISLEGLAGRFGK